MDSVGSSSSTNVNLASTASITPDVEEQSSPTISKAQLPKVTRRTSPFMQFFQTGRCKLCGREFRGLKASNGKRHLEMKHPLEYQQVLEQKRRNGTLYKGRKSLSTVCSSTDDDDCCRLGTTTMGSGNEADENGEDEDEITMFESNLVDIAATSSHYNGNSLELDAQVKECVIALEVAARPLRRLALFAGTVGISANLIENKHLKEILRFIPHLPIPSAYELEQQINLEISDVLLRIHRLLNSLPCGFCVSADVVRNSADRNSESPTTFSMGIVAHFWNPSTQRADSVALDIIQLNEHPSLEFVADTLKHAFDKTDLKPASIYRTIVDSSCGGVDAGKSGCRQNFLPTALKLTNRNYSAFYSGSCAAYRLRLALNDVVSNDIEAVRIREKVLQLLERLAQCPDVLNQLQAEIGPVEFPSNLNWSSLKSTYEKLVDQSAKINQVCSTQNWPLLTRIELQLISGLLALNKPVEQFVNWLEDDSRPTCSLLFPGLKHLLEELKSNFANQHLSQVLRTALSSRFVDVLTSIDEMSDPFYMAAAFLDPTVAYMLRSYEHLASRVIRTIASFAGISYNRLLQCSRLLGKNIKPITTSPIITNSTKSNLFGFGTFPSLKNASDKDENHLLPESLDQEINDYLRESLKQPYLQGNGFDFWRLRAKQWPLLALVAPAILVVPASSKSARKLLEGLDGSGDGNSRELWKRALLVYNDAYISI